MTTLEPKGAFFCRDCNPDVCAKCAKSTTTDTDQPMENVLLCDGGAANPAAH